MDGTPASRPTAFTPDTVALINRAYAKACRSIAHETGRSLYSNLGRHMVDLARSGERDEERLCSLSIMAVLGRSRVGEP